MKVNCKKCGKSIDVPSEYPPNEYGYGCWKCFEKDEKEAIFSDTKSITELRELLEKHEQERDKLQQERDNVLDKISETHLNMLNNIAKGISDEYRDMSGK
jgi:hypothetical protein